MTEKNTIFLYLMKDKISKNVFNRFEKGEP